MRWTGLAAACAVGLLAATVSATGKDDLPAPWFRTGNAAPATQCRAHVDRARDATADGTLVIRCDGSTSGFVTVMQQIAADDYRGRRVRLSARLRADHVAGWAGLWMRVDGEPGKILAFDNMQARALTGTSDWKPASVVLDVAPEARVIAFGVLQSGDGTTSMRGVDVDIVGLDVATTNVGATGSGAMARKPANLSFAR